MYNVQAISYTISYLYSIQYTIYIAPYTLYSIGRNVHFYYNIWGNYYTIYYYTVLKTVCGQSARKRARKNAIMLITDKML